LYFSIKALKGEIKRAELFKTFGKGQAPIYRRSKEKMYPPIKGRWGSVKGTTLGRGVQTSGPEEMEKLQMLTLGC